MSVTKLPPVTPAEAEEAFSVSEAAHMLRRAETLAARATSSTIADEQKGWTMGFKRDDGEEVRVPLAYWRNIGDADLELRRALATCDFEAAHMWLAVLGRYVRRVERMVGL